MLSRTVIRHRIEWPRVSLLRVPAAAFPVTRHGQRCVPQVWLPRVSSGLTFSCSAVGRGAPLPTGGNLTTRAPLRPTLNSSRRNYALAKGEATPAQVSASSVLGVPTLESTVGPVVAHDPWRAAAMRVAVLVQFACFLYILNNYGLSSTLCQGPSMMPTLNPAGDVVLVEHVTTVLGLLKVGDVVVAKSPTDPNAIVCKRILGMAGDTVPAKLRYAPYPRMSDTDTEVPPGRVWLQGDNIRNSTDSRNYGAVPVCLVTGRVFFKVWPLSQAGFIKNQYPPPSPDTRVRNYS